MGYKFKPSKGVAKRMKVTKTGKLKHRHEKNSHLRSARTSKTKRHLGRAGVLHEGHARNMRQMLGLSKLKPNRTTHERALAAAEKETAGAGAHATETTSTVPVGRCSYATSQLCSGKCL